MRCTLAVLLLLGALAPAGCGAGFKYEPQTTYQADRMVVNAPPATAAEHSEPAAPQREVPRFTVVQARKLVYTGEFKLIVEDVVVAQSAAREMTEKLGGYLGRLDATSMVIRVPAAKFNEAVAALPAIGTVAERSIRAQDVTDKHLDLATRLKNAQALAARLRALLDKAQNVKEALWIEEQLARVQTDIDQIAGRLKLLDNQIAYATLTLEFHGAVRYTPPTLRVKLPISWLRELGLQNLLRFNGQELY